MWIGDVYFGVIGLFGFLKYIQTMENHANYAATIVVERVCSTILLITTGVYIWWRIAF